MINWQASPRPHYGDLFKMVVILVASPTAVSACPQIFNINQKLLSAPKSSPPLQTSTNSGWY